jgi:hypothetical protein
MKQVALVALGLIAVSACGGDPPAKNANDANDAPPTVEQGGGKHSGGGPAVSQELGSMDIQAVEKVFNNLLNGPLETKCHKQGRDRIEYLAGDVKLFTRVAQDGSVRYGYFEDTNIGDRDTEKCILEVLKTAPWPKPTGGEGEVRNQMGWTGGDERPPAPWTADKVTGALDKDRAAKDAVNKCTSGSTGFKITGYVEPGEVEGKGGDAPADDAKKPAAKKGGPSPAAKKKDAKKEPELDHGGRFKAIGMSVNSKANAEKIDCLVDALKTLSLPSPGSYAAKVTFSL